MRIVVFLVFLNASAEMLRSTGVADAMGIDATPGAAEKLAAAIEAASTIQPTGGFAETLFSLYVGLATTVDIILTAITGGPTMLINLGVPVYVVVFLFAPAGLLIGRDVIYMLAGRSP